MKPEFVYLLSDYGEHGAERVCATLDRFHLPQMLETKLATGWAGPQDAKNADDARKELAALLQRPDADLAKHNLMQGWGGIQLHVVRLA